MTHLLTALIVYVAVWLLVVLVMCWYGEELKDAAVVALAWPVFAWAMLSEIMWAITRMPK